MNDYLKILLILVLSFICCFVFCKIHLHLFKIKPKDSDEVSVIKANANFISCGGVDFLLSTILIFTLFNLNNLDTKNYFLLIFISIYYGIIGFIDDLIKAIAKDNKGLSGYIRVLFELIGAIIVLKILSINFIEFVKLSNAYVYIGSFAIIYIIFCFVGCCNAINLTDGLDGLVSITYILALTPFLYIALVNANYIITTFIVSLIGSLLAYLCFNFNPSKIIMGDVGSISLGALLAIIAFILNSELLILIAGLIYIVEALSVILQVSYFKLTKGKRIFKMTPLHYHFIKKGMKESNAVLMFTIFGIILSIIASIIGVILWNFYY